MDPDMVRQQVEAEREALGLQQKAPIAAMAKALELSAATGAAARADPAPMEAAPAPASVLPETTQPGPQLAPPAQQRKRRPAFMDLGNVPGYGLGGAILGGGLGLAAAWYLELSAEQAKLAAAGAAGVMAMLSAMTAFFFTGRRNGGR